MDDLDLKNTSPSEIYTVKTKNKEIGQFTDFNEAIIECNHYYKAFIINATGDVLHESTLAPKYHSTKVYMVNNKVSIDNRPVYPSPSSGIPKDKLNGDFYIANEHPIYGRYQIKLLKSSTKILGYVDQDDLN